MINQHCIICNDYKHFKIIESNAKRIYFKLKELDNVFLKNYSFDNRKINELKNRTYYYSNPHFMCGQCSKANLSYLHNVEDSIAQLAFKFSFFVKDENIDKKTRNKILFNTRQLLQGFYPNLAQLFFV